MNDLLLPAIQKSTGQDLDPYYNLVSLHLKGDVNTGRNYNAFSDASSNNFLLTTSGDVRGSSFSPYGTSWSLLTRDRSYLSIPASTDYDLINTDYTVEFWFKLNAFNTMSSSGNNFFGNGLATAVNGWSFGFAGSGTTVTGIQCATFASSAQTYNTFTVSIPDIMSQWCHVAIVRSGSGSNNLKCYINGVSQGGTLTAGTYSIAGSTFTLGSGAYTQNGTYSGNADYYISNIRITKSALYLNNFTPSTSPLTAVAGTVLLLCHTNRLINGVSNAVITSTGHTTTRTSVSSFSPFLETDTTSGSGYFDGSGDYLSIPGNSAFAFGTGGAGTGDFCLEAWVYPNSISTATFDRIVSTSDYNGSGFDWTLNTNSSSLFLSGTSYGISNVITKAWNHIVYTRSSGVLRGFLNGVLVVYNASVTTNVSAVTELRIGVGYSGSHYSGYINGLRILKGSVPEAYQTSSTTTNTQIFTPPITSISAVANTQLLTLQERGAYNTIGFQDESEYQHVITRPSGANVAQGTFSPFSQTGWGNYFNGSSYLNAGTTLFNYTTGNASTTTFTIEAFIYLNSYQTATNIFHNPCIIGKGDIYLNLGVNGSGNLIFYHYDGTVRSITGSSVIPLTTWTYVAVTVTGGTATIYVNGTSVGSGTWYGIQAAGQNTTSLIGRASTNASSLYFNGYISNLRVSTVARTITTPTTAYTNDGNTALLTAQSNRFVDNSSSPITLTLTGSPTVVAFSPFKPVAYDPAVHGGSAYFDGSGDYLEMPYNPAFKYVASQDFCLEFWAYAPSALTASYVISQVTSNNWGIILGVGVVTSGRMGVTYGNGSTASTQSLDDTGAFPIGQWVHVVLCRTSGTIALFVNGTRRSSASNTNAINLTGDRGIRIGAHQDGAAAQFWSGYISGMRSIQGSNPYDATLTTLNVPSVPPSVVGNTSLLLNFTNAGVIDSTGKNVIETVGNAGVVTTAIKKYGSGSMFFDGTGDYVTSYNANALFRIGNIYTIELWFYTTTIAAGAAGLICLATGASTNSGINIYRSGSEIICNDGTTGGTGPSSGSSAITANTWAHLAVVSDGTTTKMYIDGVLKGTYSGTTASSAALTYATVGANGDKSGVLNGYIDDFRITRGYARYVTGTGDNANKMVFAGTNTLALPTKALPDRGTSSTLTTEMAAPSTVEALVVAGGGPGGAGLGGVGGAGGGGAGGFREFVGGNAIAVTAGVNYPLTIGAGGPGPSSGASGSNGVDSLFSTITSTGGGKGGSSTSITKTDGSSGGSGGGGQPIGGVGANGGPTVSPSQGNAGGTGTGSSPYGGGGGGGAGGVGGNATGSAAGSGGAGAVSSISGVPVTYAGGGGGGTYTNSGAAGAGGSGIGGAGALGQAGNGWTTPTGTAGTANTGSGGGGGASNANNGSVGSAGGKGGSGVVIIAYPTSYRPLKASLGLVYTIDTVTRAGYRVYRFTAGTGTISW